MPQYTYTIRATDGQEHHGTIEAADRASAAQKLRAGGAIITTLTAQRTHAEKKSIWDSLNVVLNIPLKERVVFAVNLSVMVGSGLPVARALHNLSEQTRNKSVQAIVMGVYAEVVKGTALSDAMARYPAMFDHLFVHMVRVGEAGGNLEESLTIIAAQMEKEQELRARVRGAMLYPVIVFIAMIGIGVLMLTYILPQILSVFKDMQVTLPRSTQVLIWMSTTLKEHAGMVIGGSILLFVAIILFLRTKSGRITMSWIAITLPIVKTMGISVNCARFGRIYGSLLRSGVPVIEALTIVRDTLRNTYYCDALDQAIRDVERGLPLGGTVRRFPKIFPILVPQMIDVGEETGKTTMMLLKVAEFYEGRVDQMTKNLSSIIEPLLMIVIGSAVGFFAVAMLKPMYSVMQNIQ